MSENNNKKDKKKRTKFTFLKLLKILLITILILGIVAGGTAVGMVLSILKDAPEIDPSKINSSLDQTSFIYDLDENLIEKIQAAELRTIVSLSKMPEHLKDAFTSIEDERFRDHMGIDPKGIAAAAVDNIKAGGIVRGASTITQQLVKNLYLSPDQKWTRKITEAYLALQMERVLHKDQILEAYLNRISLGQNAYGVQEASQTYFSKNVEDLSIAESAILAGIVKSPLKFQPYIRVRPDKFDSSQQFTVGEADILGERYILVYNEESLNRQRLVLKKMYELEKISKAEYDTALAEDIKTHLVPGGRKEEDITSYFSDYVKTQVVEALQDKFGYSKERAFDELYTGGLKIYSTIDVTMQKQLEDVYANFTEILLGNIDNIRGPALIDWRLDKSKNIIDQQGNLIYFKKENLLNDDFDLVIENGSYSITDGNITIKNRKLTPYPKHIDIGDYYLIDDKKNLVSHVIGSIVIPEEDFKINENKEIVISKTYLDKSEGFYRIDDNENLIISEKYFFRSHDGVVQPQSASVTIDYRNGHIKAIVGGRDIDGSRILNRATDSQRQPGSVIKPISVYLPALDNGYNLATGIDDIPFYSNGKLWPKNWYSGYRGIQTLRQSVEQSVNVNAVKTLDSIGIQTSLSYLEKLGIINPTNPEKDSFVTALENPSTNDENLAALALGGMTRGLTPLEVTAAFGAIANDGVFRDPIAFTKVLDKYGNVLLENTSAETIVVSPQIAYIMGDALRTTISSGFAGRAKLANMATAGKTGTTQKQADIWFVGYTPYYVSGVWIGNDSPGLTLTKGSGTAAQLWQNIMTRAHEGLESKTSFNKPEGIVSASVCSQSGLLANDYCSSDPRGVIRTEIFAQGTVPKSTCDLHVSIKIDTSNNKIANDYCPEELTENRVFIERKPPYLPSDNGGIVPADYRYNAPTSVCNDHNLETFIRAEEEKIEAELEEKIQDDENSDKDPVEDENALPLDPIEKEEP